MSFQASTSLPFSYNLEILTIVNNEGHDYDIRELLMGLRLYESITSNFLLGEIKIADATGMLENARIFGQETLRLRFTQPQGYGDETSKEPDIIDKVFRIYRVGNIRRLGENTTTYNLSFCSPEFLTAKRIRISQAFRGSMTEIAAKIARDHLGILPTSVDSSKWTHGAWAPTFEVRENSKGDNYHVVIPNWTASYAINWLCSQAQGIDSKSGLQDSFFFFDTANGGYRIQSIAGMISVNYLGGGPDAHFAYVPAASGVEPDPINLGYDFPEAGQDQMGMGRRIISYDINSSANILKGTIEGLFASKHITVNNTYKFQTERSFNFLETFYSGQSSINKYPLVRGGPESLYYGEAINDDKSLSGKVTPYGIPKLWGKKNIGSYSDAHIMLTGSSHFVNDESDNIHQATYNSHLGSQQFRAAVKQLLKYYTMNLLLPTRTDISVGKMIDIKIPQTQPGHDEIVDAKFHSGTHLITHIMWELTQQECRTNIKVMKDSFPNRIEDTKKSYPDLIEEV